MATNAEGLRRIRHAYSYRRISRKRQSKGSGISRQDEKAVSIAEDKGWKLQPDSLVDLGVSAFTGKNVVEGALGRFIQAAREGRLKPNSVLIFEHFDRLQRQSLRKAEKVIYEMLELGVALHNGFNGRTYTATSLDTPMDKIEIILGLDQAYQYSANLSERVNKAFSKKYKAAKEDRKVQLGGWQPAWVDFVGPDKGEGHFIPNPKAEIVARIVDMYLDGHSMLDLARYLNGERIACLEYGKRWTQGQIRHLLTSEALKGDITIKGQTFRKYYPEIVDDKEFDELQGTMAQRAIRKGGSREDDYPSNLLPRRCVCAHCGGSVSTHNSRIASGIERYFKCQDARNGNGCIRDMMPIRKFDEALFWQVFSGSPEKIISQTSVKHAKKATELEGRIKSATKTLTRLNQLVADDLATQETYAGIRTAKTLREDLQKELVAVRQAQAATEDAPSRIEALKAEVEDIGGRKRWEKLEQADLEIEALRTNIEFRKKLRRFLPSIIKEARIDLVERSYVIEFTNGKISEQMFCR